MSSAPSTPFELKGLNPDSTATTPTLESKGSSPDPPAPPAQPILPNSTKKSRRQLPFQGSGTPFTVHPDPTPDAHRGERQRVQVNPVGIMEAVFSHKSTTWDSITVTDLVNFDDMEAYSVKAEICERLWKIEVNRLADAVNNPEKELRFRDPEHLGQSSQEGYMELSALANQLSGALMIIEIDNQMISLRHFKSLHDESKMQRALFHLQKYFGVDKNPSSETIRTQNHTESSQRALDLLINYLTAMVARLLTQSVDGDYWQHNLIAVLAKWATKTKLLSGNLSKSADICMEGAEYEAQQISDEEAFKMNPLSKLSTLARLVERGAEGAAGILIGNLKTPEEVVRGNYHQHQISYRQGIGALLEYIIQSLKHRDYDSGLSMTSYEVCTAIYETGFEGYKALLFQDRDYEFFGTSELKYMSVAQTAFNILNKTVEDVSKSKFTSAPPTGTNAIHPIETSINWTYSEDGSRGKSPITTELTSMADVVSIMVPLLMTSPIISGNMTELMTLVALMGDAKDHVELYRFTPFKAFFCMHTSKFAAPSTVQDVSSLSGGLSMGLLSRDRLIYGVKESSNGARFSSSNTAEAYGNTEEVMRQLGLKMQGWVYEEGAVIVKCGLYVWTVITLATILVIGGLGIGFGVGNRIKGVDPFNVTTYAWVLAAFLILVCKSARVDNWSWRDFLHRRVQCRSVSELHSVTNIDEQLIMAKLLHDEYNTILTTRGPYNTVFRKKSEHGFSIDRPLDIRTMLLSGLIMFKVITPEGHALVCLDVRRGTSLSVLEHRSLETDKKHLVCRGIDRVSSSIGQDGVKRLRLPLVNSTLRWKTVLGVYTKFDALTV